MTARRGRASRALGWLAVALAGTALGPASASAAYEHAFSFAGSGSGPGELSAPHGIAVGPDGNLYVADQDNDRIQVFEPDGTFVRQWGSSGSANGELSAPRGIAVSPGGEVYVADRVNNRIQVFSSNGTFLRKWGSAGTAAGLFNSPGWIDLDSAGNVYVTDTFNYRVQVFTSQGVPITQFGSQGAGPGQFSLLTGIAVTADGVYVADHSAGRIQLFTTAGTLVSELGGLTHPGLMANPWGIAEDTSESLLVAELGVATGDAAFGVNRISRAGAALDAFGPAGSGDGELSQPRDIAVAPSGDVYVTDADLSRVTVFRPTGGAGPQTTIDSGPASAINTAATGFEFSSTTAGATFECSLDSGPWEVCQSPHSVSGLTEGTHTFAVRAVDGALVDQTPAQRQFTVDLTAPEPPGIVTDASDPSKSASVGFSLSGEQGASFECRLDEAEFASCGSSPSYGGLGEGQHRFEARQTDAAGNVGDAASFEWRIDLTAPDTSVSSAPPEWHASTSATIAYSSNEPGTFVCTLDGSPVACSAPSKTLTGLSQGAHTFTVRAVDEAGNPDATPESRTFNVDTVAPAAPGISGPSGLVASKVAAFDISAEPDAAIECGLDSAGLASCPAYNEYSDLSEGSHQFRARQTDRAGNVSPVATRNWTVDTEVPTVAILTNPKAADSSTTAAFTYSANEPAGFQCRLDDGAWADCPGSGESYPGLALGAHTFGVRAIDAAGNGSDPAFFSWVIVPNAPPQAQARSRRVIPRVLYRLDGRESTDAEGPISGWEWRASKSQGKAGSVISTAATLKYRVRWPKAYITLEVTDGDGASASDDLALRGR